MKELISITKSIMKIDEFPQNNNLFTDEEPPKPVFEKKPLNWEEDMQMYSKFLDRKVCN